jgi:DNA/RNA endonuclease YhcR with UshA esterase domain
MTSWHAHRPFVISLLLICCFGFAACGSSSKTVASCPSGAIRAENANSAIGQQAVIEGTIVSTSYASSSNGSPTFLDFHDPYQGHFIVVIWGDHRSNFSGSPEDAYKGKHVCVHGLVQAYAGSSEIMIDSSDQIDIVQ